WVTDLLRHFRKNERLGLLGPVTNNIGNEAKVEIAYSNMQEMEELALAYTSQHPLKSMPIPCVAFFCVMMRRQLVDQVGGLDESYGMGFFEDDDYCRRVEQLGFEIRVAEDVFIHHHLSASFEKLPTKEREELFLRNKRIYESKWGKWNPHTYRRESLS